MRATAQLAGWLMVAAALIVALLAARVVAGSLSRSVLPASVTVFHSDSVSVVVSDDCRTGNDPGDPAGWPAC
jgi:hypothetical protein